MKKKVILITGCSSGIGLLLAKELSKNYYVFATLRKDTPLLAENKHLHKVYLDVTNSNQIANAIQKIVQKAGQIDVLVNNAGYGLIGPFEKTSISEAKKQVDTNLFGAMRTIKKVIPIMKEQGGGTIVNISSIAGIIGSKNMAVYCASKFALEGLSESLYEELRLFGIKIKLIEFGHVKNTSFGKNIIRKKVPLEYRVDSKNLRKEVKIRSVINTIKKAINDKGDKLRYMPDNSSKKRISEKLKNPEKTDYLSLFKDF